MEILDKISQCIAGAYSTRGMKGGATQITGTPGHGTQHTEDGLFEPTTSPTPRPLAGLDMLEGRWSWPRKAPQPTVVQMDYVWLRALQPLGADRQQWQGRGTAGSLAHPSGSGARQWLVQPWSRTQLSWASTEW